MRILVADDNPISVVMLEEILRTEGHTPVVAADGLAAWELLRKPDPPSIAILDWMMPEMDGITLCRKIRADPRLSHLYIIMFSVLDTKEEIVKGLEAGANDYVTKPFNPLELKARIAVGARVAALEKKLADHQLKARVADGTHVAALEKKLTSQASELEKALAEVKQLRQFLPICAYCKKIRDDDNYWRQLERYVDSHLDRESTHGICPACYAKKFDTTTDQTEK